MTITTEAERRGMHRAGQVVAETLRTLKDAIRPGVTPAELDALAGQVFRRHGAQSAPRMTYGAPVNVFVSVTTISSTACPRSGPWRPGTS